MKMEYIRTAINQVTESGSPNQVWIADEEIFDLDNLVYCPCCYLEENDTIQDSYEKEV